MLRYKKHLKTSRKTPCCRFKIWSYPKLHSSGNAQLTLHTLFNSANWRESKLVASLYWSGCRTENERYFLLSIAELIDPIPISPSPWYNRDGWLGEKHQLTYLLLSHPMDWSHSYLIPWINIWPASPTLPTKLDSQYAKRDSQKFAISNFHVS